MNDSTNRGLRFRGLCQSHKGVRLTCSALLRFPAVDLWLIIDRVRFELTCNQLTFLHFIRVRVYLSSSTALESNQHFPLYKSGAYTIQPAVIACVVAAIFPEPARPRQLSQVLHLFWLSPSTGRENRTPALSFGGSVVTMTLPASRKDFRIHLTPVRYLSRPARRKTRDSNPQGL
jgi:hypothetical protein